MSPTNNPLPSVLVVDDTPINLSLMTSVLKGFCKVKVANNGLRALVIARSSPPPDLILLDVMMPEMDGYEVCARLKANHETAEIPVIFLTAKTESEDETKGFECGAVDYIPKPIKVPVVLARVKAQLGLKRMADFLRDKNEFLETEVQRRTEAVQAVQEVTILAMSSLAETRDNETGNHILLKPGKLTPEEFEIMKTHTTVGYEAIVRAEKSHGATVDFLQPAKEIALYHQEKWDGSGYPEGLAGQAIPLSARLMALADVYDALISKRVYKNAMSHDEAMAIIRQGRGTHFDPDVYDAFCEVEADFRKIAAEFSDA